MTGLSRATLLAVVIFVVFTNGLNAKFLMGECAMDNYCSDHGTCFNGPVRHGWISHWCSCDPGYGGDDCEMTCDKKCSPGERCEFDGLTGKQVCVCKDCEQPNQIKLNCADGFGGPSCSLQGWCYPDKCLNGGNCNGTACVCPPGLTGTHCEIDINECETGQLFCFNGGTCVNTFGSAKCHCMNGLGGDICVEVIGPNEHEYTAEEKMYLGIETRCLMHFSERYPNGTYESCKNNGLCVFDSLRNVTSCECPSGFIGEICEIKLDQCLENPCENGGKCENTEEDGFMCSCVDGFEGTFCETAQDNCRNSKCSPDSICVSGPYRYTCDCKNGTMGEYCDKPDPCQQVSNLCQNGGLCYPEPENGGFQCLCNLKWRGEFCHLDVDECAAGTATCANNSTCVNVPGGYECDCQRGYNGTRCEEPVDTCESEQVNCQNGGRCYVDNSSREPVCNCRRGFIGERCEIACPPGFTGVRCDLKLSQPSCGWGIGYCSNDGKCLSGHCQCQSPYTGNHCEYSRSEAKKMAIAGNTCRSDPCLNNATCIDVVGRIGYACLCREGFEGEICEKRIDYCATNPCYNGGSCKTNTTGFTCECPSEFLGKQCEVKQPFDCTEQNCLNGGACIENGTKCECSYGFFGSKCDKKVDLSEFVTKDRLLREMCESRNCSSRYNDGNCDLDCNFAACDFDGGDCSGRQKPFAKCAYGNMCAHLFADGVCNQACNNENCLFDGMDCMAKVPRCPKKTYCAARFADGHCDKECDLEECGFDGGDCNKNTNSTGNEILNDIRVTILMSPEKFQKEGGDILMKISHALRSIIRIQQDEDGPLVYVWNGGENQGDRIAMDVEKLEDQHVLSKTIRRYRRDALSSPKGVMVWLEAEKYCKSENCLFSNSQSVVDFLSAEIAKKGEKAVGAPIYEALVAKPSRSRSSVPLNWSTSQVILGVLICFVLVGSTVAGVMVVKGDDKRSRKRKIISAPTWMPPTEHEDSMKSRKGSQNSLLHSPSVYFLDAKRKCQTKIDNNNTVAHYTQYQYFQQQQQQPEAAQFSADFGGYGHSGIHLEASGNSPITETFTAENVQMIDSKYRRTVLHWLASNSSGKPEDEIVDEAQMAIDAGADVNARDCDENTPLMLAVKAKRTRLCIVLMKAGGDPTIFNKSERSCLHEAAVNLDLRMLQILLTDRRMVQEIDELDRNGRTALMEVARLDQDIHIATLLIAKGAKIEEDGASRKDSEIYKGRTVLHYAALCGNMRMLEFFISVNSNKDKQDEAGHTPLMLACKEGHIKAVQYLINCGASLESTDLLDRSAIMIAEAQHHYDIVELIKRALVDQEYMEAQMRQAHSNKITKGQRPTIKSVKRNASRKGYPPPSSSRDSTLHMTPPSSDGSPSPLQYSSVYEATLPPSSAHHTSPIAGMYSMQSNTSGSGSTGMVSDASSPEYQPQDSSDLSSMSNGGPMWYAASPPYHNPMVMSSSNKMSEMHPGYTQSYHPQTLSTSTLIPDHPGMYQDNHPIYY